MAGPAPDISFEAIFSPEQLADPYPAYRTLRESAPVFHVPDTNMWLVSRYADVTAVLRDKRLGHLSASDANSNLTEEQRREMMDNPALAGLSRTMLLQNPPDHTRLRSLVVRAFDARRIERMRDRIRSIANELVDALLESNSGDLVRGFNHPLPVIVIPLSVIARLRSTASTVSWFSSPRSEMSVLAMSLKLLLMWNAVLILPATTRLPT